MTILTTQGGLYTCTECGTVKAVMGTEPEKMMKCCKSDELVKHIQGEQKVIVKNPAIVPPTPIAPPKEKLPDEPKTFNPSTAPGTVKAPITVVVPLAPEK